VSPVRCGSPVDDVGSLSAAASGHAVASMNADARVDTVALWIL
jgi:hypothetical protein